MEEENQNHNKNEIEKSTLSIVSLVLAIIPFTTFIGLILAIIDLLVNNKKKKTDSSRIAIIIFFAWTLFYLCKSCSSNDSYTSSSSGNVTITSSSDTNKNILIDKIVYDKNNIQIKIKSYDSKNKCFNVLIDNESDTEYLIEPAYISVNGIMVESDLDSGESIPAYTKLNDSITISQYKLDIANIDKVSNVSIQFIFSNPTTLIEDFKSDTYHIDLTKDENDQKGKEIYSDSDIAIYKFYNSSDLSDSRIEILNKTDSVYTFYVDNVKINNYLMTDFPSYSGGVGSAYFLVSNYKIFPNDSMIVQIVPSSDMLSDNGINKIKSIKLDIISVGKDDLTELGRIKSLEILD